MSEAIAYTRPNGLFEDLLNIIEKMKPPKRTIQEIRVPAFRINEFEEELKTNGVVIEEKRQDYFSFLFAGGIPVVIVDKFHPIFMNNLAIILFSDGTIGRIESKNPIDTADQIIDAIRKMEEYSCLTSKTPELPFSTDSREILQKTHLSLLRHRLFFPRMRM